MQRNLIVGLGLWVFLGVYLTGAPVIARPVEAAPAVVSDSLYSSHHPCLLVKTDELVSLGWKVIDGGHDDVAFAYVQSLFDTLYQYASHDQLLDDDFAQDAIPILGLLVYLDSARGEQAVAIGKSLTLYIADNWEVDTDGYYSALRLRALSMGYDMFFEAATPGERAYVRDEIIAYLQFMLTNFNYSIWWHPPYISNVSAMIAASIGLAAIVLDGEVDAAVTASGLDTADGLFHAWLQQHVDDDGCYTEGVLYGAWSLRNLIYYFHARFRYDGVDYSALDKIRKMERWFVYELDPTGGGKVNNIQDCTWNDHPLPRHTTYFDWAQSRWGSRLSHYIWRRISAPYGFDAGDKSDKVGTILWGMPLIEVSPNAVLPNHRLWHGRGLYYFRSGWPDAGVSDDVMFSFYSGPFRGGHAQEDQNQYTLVAYGEKFVIDHGLGLTAKQSEAHNMVLIDGAGQHNAGGSIGTDGFISQHVLGDFTDYLVGDATTAYTTHSPYNNPNVPFNGFDWSWGYTGANPVLWALRTVIVVHDPDTPPYFVIVDDIDKDGTPHNYAWRMHTAQSNEVDLSTNPVTIAGATAAMDVHALYPSPAQLVTATQAFDNLVEDPDATVVSFATTAINPYFTFLLYPRDNSTITPLVYEGGISDVAAAFLAWPDGSMDILVVRHGASGEMLEMPLVDLWPADRLAEAPAELASILKTDARLVLIRLRAGLAERYLSAEGTELWVGATQYVHVGDGPATVARGRDLVKLDRPDADFVLFAPGIEQVYWEEQRIYVIESNGYIAPDPTASVSGDRTPNQGLRASAYPNPFNPRTHIRLDLAEKSDVRVVVYDSAGRRVRDIWSGSASAGRMALEWDGRNQSGEPVASGVYLLRVTAGTHSRTLKLTLIK